mmetsp:Transcript_107685/g.303344  ORF Transcript_107685/g.303344 Transcript_107685/m.303344 type:complete len:732 (+) Transcript_107685:100-2295(+)
MAGRTMKLVSLPDKNLAYTNRVYLTQDDFGQLFPTATSGIAYADIKGSVFTVSPFTGRDMDSGAVALSKPQREWARIAINCELLVIPFKPPANATLGACTIEVDMYLKANVDRIDVSEEDLETVFRERFANMYLSVGQTIVHEHEGRYVFRFDVTAVSAVDVGDGKPVPQMRSGLFSAPTEISFQSSASGKVQILSNKASKRSIFRPDFNFEELGIGGLSKEFGDIFRRAFAARVFPQHLIRQLGINHVRGMLLYGPPGTGKTLIARQLAKFLKSAEPKIINGPEVLNKYVGQSEENIRKLFADAEKEQKQLGDNSQLHIVIFDEIDAICKSRGSSRDSSGVGDSIVNQLLSKIDGVDSLNNILLIGMTNRIDLMDEALLRPGRLEVHVEISLPDENGRQEILNIHTQNMKTNNLMDGTVSIPAIAKQTKNFSGAELEGLVRSATSFALNRQVNVTDISKPKDLTSIVVTQDDFDLALSEIKPAFGCHDDEFEQALGTGIVQYSKEFEEVFRYCRTVVEGLKNSDKAPLQTLLLSGIPGCGKTALAAHLARSSNYPFVRRIASENYVGFTEQAKVSAITKVFEDAYKSQLSLVVLDDLERLIDYVRIGMRFSNVIFQALFALLKKQPPKTGRRLLVIATTSDPDFLHESELSRVFNVSMDIPVPKAPQHIQSVLAPLAGFDAAVISEICAKIAGKAIGIRKLLQVAELAVQQCNPVTTQCFMDCLSHAGLD